MTTKMKGLLKGLRYISQIFDCEEEEQEMMIGYPTDVRHVAHIGWDGPTVNAPSWMNEFKSSEHSEGQGDAKDEEQQVPIKRSGSRSRSIERTLSQKPRETSRSSRRHASTGSAGDPDSSHKPRSRSGQKTSKSTGGATSDHVNSYSEPSSPTNSTFGGRDNNDNNNNDNNNMQVKKTRRKKSKDHSSLGNNNNNSSSAEKSRNSQRRSGSLESTLSHSGSVSSVKDDDAPPSHKPT